MSEMDAISMEEVSVLEADSTGRIEDVDVDDIREPVSAVLNLILSNTPLPPNLHHIHLRGTKTTIGRAVTNEIILDSLQVSRHHATLEYKEERWFIKDMSTNGILVNHKKYAKNDWTILQDMDTVQFIPTGALQYRIRYAYRTAMPPEIMPDGRLREVKTIPKPRDPSPGPSKSPIQIDLADGGDSDADSNASVSLLCNSIDIDEMFEDAMSSMAASSKVSGKRRLAESLKSEDEAERKKVCGPFKKEDDDDDEELLELDYDADAGYLKAVKAVQSSPIKRETIIKSPKKSLCKHNPEQAAIIEHLKRELQQVNAKCQKLELDKVTSKFNYESIIKELRTEGANYKEEFHKQIVTLLEQDFSCSICSEIFIQAVVLNCGHSFCEFCIGEWTKRKTDCPVCRKMVTDQIKHVEIENFLVKIHELMSGEAKSRRTQSIKERHDAQEKAKESETRRRNPANAADYGFPPDRFVDFLAELQHINDMFGGAHRAQFGHGGPPGIIPTDVTAQRAAAARNRDILTAQLNMRRRSARMRARGAVNDDPPSRVGVIQRVHQAIFPQDVIDAPSPTTGRRRGRPANRRVAVELERIDDQGFQVPGNRPRRFGGPSPRVITLDDSTDEADAPVQVVPEPQPGPSRLVNC